MRDPLALLPIILPVGLLLSLFGIAIVSGFRRQYGDRRRILAEGVDAEAVVTRIVRGERSDRSRVRFSFQTDIAGPNVEVTQETTGAALVSTGLQVGSRVRAYYLAKRPRYAFIKELAIAERVAKFNPAATDIGPERAPSVHFISYAMPGAKSANASRWTGDGTISIGADVVRFTAQLARPFWFPKVIEQEVMFGGVSNVEVFDNVVRCEIAAPQQKPRALQFRAVNAIEAEAIGARLSGAKTSTFVPRLAEQAAFNARLLEVSPHAPVTPVLIWVNVAMFVLSAALGGGIVIPNGDVLIRLGSDYTPLTASGQWWRLFTSIFLHFGIFHLALNMWALYVNGVLAERLYGSSRYLMLYVTAGLAGSVASFLWHPFVNGAGASGAIFGVLGALFAFSLRTDMDVPKSVLVSQRSAAGVFIVISLLNAARVKGVDNAAHMGGVAAGFVMGWLLCRPLKPQRNEQDWTPQWIRALTVTAGSVIIVGYYLLNGQWHPRVVHDAGGRPVLLSELTAPPRAFGGVTLGMTSAQLLRAKGSPLKRNPADWLYNSVDAAHNGVVDVYLTDGEPATVRAILFWGEANAEPPGMPNLLGFSRQDLLMRYGRPDSASGFADSSYLYFRNGLVVYQRNDKVEAYGVYIMQH